MNSLIANATIETYKNNKGILEELKLKFKSGRFTSYDIALYNTLLEVNKKEQEEKEKKLKFA